MTKTFTALDKIADEMKSATAAKNRYADKREVPGWQRKVDMESYHEGEAAAFHRCYEIMKAELERIRHEWQNGGIRSYGDFGLPS